MKNKKGKNIHIIWVFMLIVIIVSYYYVEVSIKPTIKSICEVQAKVIATKIINETVREELEKDELKQQILIPTYDNNGKINMIRTDALAMNVISTNIGKNVQDRIVNLEQESFTIPLGSAMGSQLMANKGPKLKFTILHEGSVGVDFITEFEESGINQTRYKIYITVNADVKVISPAVTSITTVSNNILIAELVIVGDVPNSYMKFPFMQNLTE